ncbi:MAG: endonuclease/exonuclease/phosphatase family protein [Candidatus Nanopelagicales bacterium]|nr:endonuclease/exonuclease/phosphatase family protein [Candidatus Nanopelagicales bacterium]
MSTATGATRGGLTLLPSGWPGWVVGVAVAGVAAITAFRYLGVETGVLALAIAFTPFVCLASVLLLPLALLSRSVAVAAAAVAAAAIQLSWLVPGFVGADVPSDSPATLTVMTANLQVGRADADRITGLVSANRVDLLGVQEMTAPARERLREAGIDSLLPFGRFDNSGNGIWSRYPIGGPDAGGVALEWPTLGARVEGPRGDFTFVTVHPSAPLTPGHARWTADQPLLLANLNSTRGPVVVAGDFNATLDHRVMRDLQAAGFSDAAEASGAGLNLTWPVGRLPFPAVSIDHVIYRDVDLAPVNTFTETVGGSDHLAVIVRFAEASAEVRS